MGEQREYDAIEGEIAALEGRIAQVEAEMEKAASDVDEEKGALEEELSAGLWLIWRSWRRSWASPTSNKDQRGTWTYCPAGPAATGRGPAPLKNSLQTWWTVL